MPTARDLAPPLISIVTPSYQQGSFIKATLASVRSQTHPRVEHIVVDAGSTDRTLEVLRAHEGTYDLRWISEADRGQSDGVNKALRMARGDIVGWLNSDDVYLCADVLARVAAEFARGDVDVLIGDVAWLDRNGEIMQFFIERRFDARRLLDGTYNPAQPAVFLRRAVFAREPLREDLHYAMDLDLWLRCAPRYRVRSIRAVLAGARLYRGVKSSTGAYAEEARQVRRAHGGHGAPGRAAVRLRNVLALKVHGLPRRLMDRYVVRRKLTPAVTEVSLLSIVGRQLFRKQRADYSWYWPRYVRVARAAVVKPGTKGARLASALVTRMRSRVSGDRGTLPHFLIVGVKKGGTTFLSRALRSHPEIEMAPRFAGLRAGGGPGRGPAKEVHFFDVRSAWLKGPRWYRSLFNDNGRLQGEATPGYLFWPQARRRMFRTVPNAKLIVLLREPAARAYSEYNHFTQLSEGAAEAWRLSAARGSFLETIRAELAERDLDGIVARGFYDEQLTALFALYPRERVLVLVSERARTSPVATLAQVTEFLGVSSAPFAFELEVHARAYREPMPAEARRELEEIYAPHNERLFALLGYRIPEWEPSA